jgi:hypothetical protein
MPMLAGVGLMMVCCSSSSVAAMMMGGEETPAAAAAGAGAGAEDTGPSMLKCIDTRKRGRRGGQMLVMVEKNTPKRRLVPYVWVRSICLSSAPPKMVLKCGVPMISVICPY